MCVCTTATAVLLCSAPRRGRRYILSQKEAESRAATGQARHTEEFIAGAHQEFSTMQIKVKVGPAFLCRVCVGGAAMDQVTGVLTTIDSTFCNCCGYP